MTIAEKTPEHVASVEILHCISPEAKVFKSYRDGRDQAVAFLEFNLRLFRDEFLCAYASFADYAGVCRVLEPGYLCGSSGCAGWRQKLPVNAARPDGTAASLLEFTDTGIYHDWRRAYMDVTWDVSWLGIKTGTWRATLELKAELLFSR